MYESNNAGTSPWRWWAAGTRRRRRRCTSPSIPPRSTCLFGRARYVSYMYICVSMVALMNGGGHDPTKPLLSNTLTPQTPPNQMRASKALQDRVLGNPKITVHYDTEVVDILGDDPDKPFTYVWYYDSFTSIGYWSVYGLSFGLVAIHSLTVLQKTHIRTSMRAASRPCAASRSRPPGPSPRCVCACSCRHNIYIHQSPPGHDPPITAHKIQRPNALTQNQSQHKHVTQTTTKTKNPHSFPSAASSTPSGTTPTRRSSSLLSRRTRRGTSRSRPARPRRLWPGSLPRGTSRTRTGGRYVCVLCAGLLVL